MPAILQVAPPAPHESRRIPTCPARPLVTCANALPTAAVVTGRPRPFRPVSRRPLFGGGKSEGIPAVACPDSHTYPLPRGRILVADPDLLSGGTPE